ncbi:unnamed protein product [Echinostoma caproni]|uniref:Ground-like domain-containing protein n=1 Tax=Echinostoma caproni TaxID=27848 RepID=A0A183AYG0_9TREM|nr:unnamed protein product [Echinostoma caproni]
MSAEVEVNPFRPGGELSKEAEDILKNSTILRDTVNIREVIINDPSLRRPNGTAVSPTVTDHNGSPIKPITCEVTASCVPPVEASAPYQEPKVEHVNIKPGRRPAKCCVLV